jgi:hypothetical protein
VKIAPRAPEISHLFFTDDSLLFCRATKEEVSAISTIIQTYERASGQLVNYNKSEMITSKGVTDITKASITQILHMAIKDHFTTYLGMPTIFGRSKSQIFNFLQEKIWKKLKGWKERNLSFAGRGTLIKAVAQAIPTYVMSSLLIPKGVCEQLEKLICNFWWGSTTDTRKIHWIKWQNVCNHKKKGGMGFRNLRAFNEALLAKQGWRIITQPHSLIAQVLKAKYFPKESFLKAQPKQNMSYTWRSIIQARWVLKQGCFWTIGNGADIDMWEDSWIHQKGNNTTWSKRPPQSDKTKVQDLMDTQSNSWND